MSYLWLGYEFRVFLQVNDCWVINTCMDVRRADTCEHQQDHLHRESQGILGSAIDVTSAYGRHMDVYKPLYESAYHSDGLEPCITFISMAAMKYYISPAEAAIIGPHSHQPSTLGPLWTPNNSEWSSGHLLLRYLPCQPGPTCDDVTVQSVMTSSIPAGLGSGGGGGGGTVRRMAKI